MRRRFCRRLSASPRFTAALAAAGASLAAPAFATPAPVGAAAAVTIPWGDWLAAALQPASAVLVPLAAAAVTAGVARVAPWAASVLTRQRIEAAIQAGAAYGQNAVAGVARGRTISVDLAPATIAAGTRHVIETAPRGVVRKAGGAAGVAARIFRALPLDERSSVDTVLRPALDRLRAGAGGS